MTSSLLRTALILGLLTAIGPFAIDMYLPALPSIGASLGADAGSVQMSLMAFFISLGIGQLIYGPVSDMFGRKPPLFVGLAIFAAASVGCALAAKVETLILFRFLQGFGACAGMVIPRAIVRDLHTGTDAARLMSLLMLVFSVSPILAPLTGSIIIQLADWRGVFWAVMVAALAGIVLLQTALTETRTREQRVESSIGGALESYWILLRDRHFLGLVLTGSFGVSAFFVYLSNSSFVFIGHYGISPTAYSLAFSVNAVAFIGAAQFVGRLGKRFGLRRLVKTAVLGHCATMLAVAAATAAGMDSLPVLMAMLFVGYGFLGMVVPTTAVLALEAHGMIAGTASALMGTLQFVTGAASVAIIGLFADGTPLPMVAGIAACSVLAAGFAWGTLRDRGVIPGV